MPIKTITSRANTAFKLLREITTNARARREHQASWIEGERLCEAYFKAKGLAAIAVIKGSANAGADAMIKRYPDRIRETWQLDAKLFAEISPVETSIGWGLIVPIPPSEDLVINGDVVVLDRIQDPGNLGTILRSALAAGVRHAWCTTGATDPWSPKVLRSAMGAHFAMRIATNISNRQVIDVAAAQRLRLLATALDPKAVSLFSKTLRLQEPCAWVFGNEAGGVSQELLVGAQTVVIPQTHDIESLNVAAAASICLFEMRRQREKG